jgi:hypothetical protein
MVSSLLLSPLIMYCAVRFYINGKEMVQVIKNVSRKEKIIV